MKKRDYNDWEEGGIYWSWGLHKIGFNWEILELGVHMKYWG